MTTRMLIDARHPEETRVAVVQGNRIEEFDFESADHKQIKGNIFLAKVTRVEPSLQAAFIDYGGNRHGFLAFSEIHPDYYQIPKADRDALLQEEAEHAAEEERLRAAEDDTFEAADADEFEEDDREPVAASGVRNEDAPSTAAYEAVGGTAVSQDMEPALDDEFEDEDDAGEASEEGGQAEASNGSGRSSPADEVRRKRQALRRRYKIQDVIHRRQVLLVQVVKEERGNKGAALTTYLSLAGRYCVLMPNTSSGGGISRKISNGADRKRLKSIMADLQLPKSMGCIVRTAGLQRTRTEIKRDFDYLARLWDEIRERTLGSSAPALIYGDNDLVKRAIRDIYNKDVEEIIVEGEGGFRAARTFMKLLMPGHARKVQPYQDTVPLFQRHGVEDQLSAMYNPVVQLKSGGYLVINPTEALVSIDINSGRSTREHNIEQTAYATNIEAANEIARQLRLRDMAGLVVIDFIDMESNGHVRKVEKAMKDALRGDRARIQVGRISGFGLLEMSRQRLRTGVLEASTRVCEHCEGTGLMRTAASAGLSALRMIEDEAGRGRGDRIVLRAGREAAVYVLNKKRRELGAIEGRYGVRVEVMIDGAMEGARMAVDVSGDRPIAPPQLAPILYEDDEEDLLPLEEEDDEPFAEAEEDGPDREGDERPERVSADEDAGRKRRRRRRTRGRGREEGGREEGGAREGAEDTVRADDGTDVEEAGGEFEDEPLDADDAGEPRAAEERGGDDDGEGGARRRRGRRGRRGGRGRGADGDRPVAAEGDAAGGIQEDGEFEGGREIDPDAALPTEPLLPADIDIGIAAITPGEAPSPEAGLSHEEARDADAALAEEERPKTRRRPRARKPVAEVETAARDTASEMVSETAPETAIATTVDVEPAAPKPRRSRRKVAEAVADAPDHADAAPGQATVAELAAAELDGANQAAAPSTMPLAAGGAVPVMEDPLDTDRSTTADSGSGAVGGSVEAAEGGADGSAEPSDSPRGRSGWWQRTFG